MTEKLSPMVSIQISLAGLIAGTDPTHVGMLAVYQDLLDWTDIIKADNEALEQQVERLERALVDLGDSFRGDRNLLYPETMTAYAEARNRLAEEALAQQEEDPTIPQQHPDNGGIT